MPSYYNNTSPRRIDEKRLPIVFLLDVSGSMLYDSRNYNTTQLDEMNEFVKNFIERCLNHDEAPNCTDMCFILFTDEIILTTDFYDMNDLGNHILPTGHRHPALGEIYWISSSEIKGRRINIPVFPISNFDNGTNIGKAVLHGIQVIDERIQKSGRFSPYPPILVLVSDGHLPAENQLGADGDDLASERLAIKKLGMRSSTRKDQCNLIIPLVAPIGTNLNKDRLKKYLGNFDAGYITEGAGLQFVDKILKYSISASTTLTSLSEIEDPEVHNAN